MVTAEICWIFLEKSWGAVVSFFPLFLFFFSLKNVSLEEVSALRLIRKSKADVGDFAAYFPKLSQVQSGER